ncbi:MAG TPA: YkuS family protein [Bacillales bacterium]|nr:YkuS family protein [Bacillales bacterium]
MAKIGVEQSLTDVSQALSEKGYEVITLKTEQDAIGCDCCVISGQDENVMGIQDPVIEGPVIDVRGMSADEVCREVDERIRH